ncbi:MAG TPA: hypothetical protein VFW99_02260 [Candidatus Nitrosotalea sp.]|nr:hypothetical protein [Candidatus Nitrosotalea sp.]
MLTNKSMVFHSGKNDRSSFEGIISKPLLEECSDDAEIASLLGFFDSDFGNIFRTNHFVMSWSIGDDETVKMWRYKNTPKAILIGTTCMHLIDSITGLEIINVGEVKYFDAQQDNKKERIRQPFLYKKSSYLHLDEKEVRTITRTSGTELNPVNFSNWSIRNDPTLSISVDLEMIEDVYVLSDDSESLRIEVEGILESIPIQVTPKISRFDPSQIEYL